MAFVVVIGKGGREHAIVHALLQHDSVARVVAIPGNPGIARERDTTCRQDQGIEVGEMQNESVNILFKM